MLQRERTALKVMMQLLVEQQETLKVGDIVPVGDLYDAVAQGVPNPTPRTERGADAVFRAGGPAGIDPRPAGGESGLGG